MFSQQRSGVFLIHLLCLSHSLKHFLSVLGVEVCHAIQWLIKFLWETALKTIHVSCVTLCIKVVTCLGMGVGFQLQDTDLEWQGIFSTHPLSVVWSDVWVVLCGAMS